MATANINIQADADLKKETEGLFNSETREALAEYAEMKAHPERYKRHKSFGDLLKDYNGPPVKTTILNFLRAPWHVNLISKNVRSLPGLGLFSSPHTSGNKSRWFPLTYFQRCETMAAPQPLPYAAKMP